jgi:nitrogen fixation/metabolism regulation signal transduction histidine kinase
MASKAEPRLAAFAAGWRLLAAAALLLALLELLSATRHYASALLLGAAAALLLAEAVYAVRRSRLAATPAREPDAARRHGEANALLDAVTVLLFLLSADGRIVFANRAARRLAGAEIARLDQIASVGVEAAARILSLPIGGRQIVPLADGRNMLVWVGEVATPEEGSRRLVSMQAVAGELDAVQVGAWHSMTRILAHEMMNSLTPIASLSESLVGLTDSSDAAAAARTIARQSRHLMSFVERYRSIVDLPEPAPAAIDLAAFVADLDALAGAELRGRGVAFAATLPAGAIAFQADPDLLRQALLNLLRNAGDAASTGTAAEPRVTLDCTRSEAELRFEIADNGAGAAAEHLEEMFVPFFTTKQGGAGIGLPLARQVALAHGGRLEAAANEARGMTFVLALPA